MPFLYGFNMAFIVSWYHTDINFYSLVRMNWGQRYLAWRYVHTFNEIQRPVLFYLEF